MDKINVTIEDKDNINISLNDKIYVVKNTQTKNVVPKKEQQIVKYDDEYDALEEVIVEPIPEQYIIPTGEITIKQNGVQDVTQYASANVDVYVNTLTTKTITENGTYIAKDDGYDGYSEVTVETSGANLNDYFETTITSSNRNYFYSTCIKQFPTLNVQTTSLANLFAGSGFTVAPPLSGEEQVTHWGYAFSGTMIEEFPQYNTSNGTNMSYAFASSRLITLPALDFSSANNINNVVNSYNDNFMNCGGFLNLGNNYSTSQSANYYNYRLNLGSCNNLTHDSLMNIINNLYDIKAKGCNVQQLIIGSVNLAKLTAEEIAIATDKGWSVS